MQRPEDSPKGARTKKKDMSEEMSKDMSKKICQKICQDKNVRRYMSIEMSDNTSEKNVRRCAKRNVRRYVRKNVRRYVVEM